MSIFETHCHLNNRRFEGDLELTLARAREAGVSELLLIGYDLPSSREVVEMARPEEGLFAAAGIHPHDAEAWSAETEAELRSLLARPGVLALGEIGLDFYRNLSPVEAQETAFRAQLELAEELRLPIVVHTRESVTASLGLIEPYARRGLRGIMHCWSGTVDEARRARDLGLLLGIGGVLTYKNPGELPAVVEDSPMESLLLETDSPYLPPTPYRGKRNEPAYLPLIAERIAEIKGLTAEDVAAMTRDNALRLFGLSPGVQPVGTGGTGGGSGGAAVV
jgi:TatD DNase family protein